MEKTIEQELEYYKKLLDKGIKSYNKSYGYNPALVSMPLRVYMLIGGCTDMVTKDKNNRYTLYDTVQIHVSKENAITYQSFITLPIENPSH